MIHRGDIWWADLGERRGSAPSGRRPVLVVQADSYNASRLGTVLVVIITSSPRLADLPGNVPLPAGEAEVQHDSVVNVTQVATLDRRALVARLGTADPWLVAQVDAGLRRVLDL